MSATILCLADIRFPMERANGIQTMETCVALARRGHRVRLVVRPDTAVPPRDPFAFYDVPRDGRLTIETVVAAGPPGLRRIEYLVQALSRAGRSARGDVVLTRDLGVAGACLRARPRCRGALVYESHGYAPSVSEARPGMLTGAAAPSERKQRRLARRERLVWQRADGYVTITQALAGEMVARFGPRAALGVVPDGTRIAAAPAWTEAARSGPPVVAYAGHLYPWKGVDLVIDALVSLPGVRGLIVGGHPQEADLARLQVKASQAGVSDRVTFTGMVAPSRVAGLLAGADVLVLPNPPGPVSASYTSPLKLFEYLAAARPIVASDLPAFREVLHDGANARLFEAGSAAALAGTVRAVLADARLAERLARGAAASALDYSWDRRAERLERVFEDARARRNATGAA